MDSDTTTLVVDLALIAFLMTGTLLVLVLIVGFIILFPRIKRILGNIETASQNAASTWANLAQVSETAKEAAIDLASLARTAAENAPELASKVQKISDNVKTTTARVADASRLLEHIGAPQDAAGQSWTALGQFFKKLLGR